MVGTVVVVVVTNFHYPKWNASLVGPTAADRTYFYLNDEKMNENVKREKQVEDDSSIWVLAYCATAADDDDGDDVGVGGGGNRGGPIVRKFEPIH